MSVPAANRPGLASPASAFQGNDDPNEISDDDTDDSIIEPASDFYHQHLSAEAVAFLFSEVFSDAVKSAALNAARMFAVSESAVIEEFRRLLVIKVFVTDVDGSKISPTPLMDQLWHAAILDTKFYAQLQSVFGVMLHHNPSGAAEEQTSQRQKRLETMQVLYKNFFNDEAIDLTRLYCTLDASLLKICEILRRSNWSTNQMVHSLHFFTHAKVLC
ncbi:unnamed protein product [Periconia digitata]|uniref:Uncharacterized protein n=1 Tax=Periconia digitata TaxID=1303443 RepID=A0A9W4XRG7_9PLEO|nr:unnamed protein product [Periconia digitata]